MTLGRSKDLGRDGRADGSALGWPEQRRLLSVRAGPRFSVHLAEISPDPHVVVRTFCHDHEHHSCRDDSPTCLSRWMVHRFRRHTAALGRCRHHGRRLVSRRPRVRVATPPCVLGQRARARGARADHERRDPRQLRVCDRRGRRGYRRQLRGAGGEELAKYAALTAIRSHRFEDELDFHRVEGKHHPAILDAIDDAGF